MLLAITEYGKYISKRMLGILFFCSFGLSGTETISPSGKKFHLPQKGICMKNEVSLLERFVGYRYICKHQIKESPVSSMKWAVSVFHTFLYVI